MLRQPLFVLGKLCNSTFVLFLGWHETKCETKCGIVRKDVFVWFILLLTSFSVCFWLVGWLIFYHSLLFLIKIDFDRYWWFLEEHKNYFRLFPKACMFLSIFFLYTFYFIYTLYLLYIYFICCHGESILYWRSTGVFAGKWPDMSSSGREFKFLPLDIVGCISISW